MPDFDFCVSHVCSSSNFKSMKFGLSYFDFLLTFVGLYLDELFTAVLLSVSVFLPKAVREWVVTVRNLLGFYLYIGITSLCL